MNVKRRERLREAITILEEIKEEEFAAFDNLHESLQSSEHGERMDENVSNLDEAISQLEGILE